LKIDQINIMSNPPILMVRIKTCWCQRGCYDQRKLAKQNIWLSRW